MTETLTIDIEQTIRDDMQIAQYRVVSRFCSRRNQVYRIQARLSDSSSLDFVYKVYVSGDIEKEYDFLNRLKGHNVPAVLAKGKKALCLSYVGGQLLIEKLEETERDDEPFTPFLDKLIDFLARFYEALPGFVYGDINLRNFIIAHEDLYGIDLEQAREGSIASDIGRTAAYLLMYDPACTPYKKSITDYFIDTGVKRFSISKEDVLNCMNRELDTMQARRCLRETKISQGLLCR